MIASRKANAGCFNLRQIALSTFDQIIHTSPKADVAKVFADTYHNLLGIKTIENTCMPANFGHMTDYDAQYYGYMASVSRVLLCSVLMKMEVLT